MTQQAGNKISTLAGEMVRPKFKRQKEPPKPWDIAAPGKSDLLIGWRIRMVRLTKHPAGKYLPKTTFRENG
jgi:hypothetical protein